VTAPNSALVKNLTEVEKLLQTRNYEEAEARLKAMQPDYPGEPRLFFTMAQTASLWARDTTDDDLQTQRTEPRPGQLSSGGGRGNAGNRQSPAVTARMKRWAAFSRSSIIRTRQ